MTSTSRLALGTVQFGLNYGVSNKSGQVPKEEIIRIISRAATASINTLDTAIGYGVAEKRLGEIGVKGWQVVTKLPPLPEDTSPAAWVRSLTNASASRLNITRLYGLLLHKPENLFDKGGGALYDAMIQMKSEGLVEKIGISAYDSSAIEATLARFPLDIVQAPYSIIDRRLNSSGCLASMDRHGIEFHARSIFLQGLLLMNMSDRPRQFSRWKDLWRSWDQWLAESRLRPMEACLNFVAADLRVSRLVVGVENLAQLNEIIHISQKPVSMPFPDILSSHDPELINPSNW